MNFSKSKKYRKALDFATQKHKGQTRIGGDAYITHPIAVAQLVEDWGYGKNYVLTALFHDLLEDTDATEKEIKKIGGKKVLSAVKLLTKSKPYVMSEYVEQIKNNNISRVVKAADRLHNIRCAKVTDEKFKRRYILETYDWYTDLCCEMLPALKDLALSVENGRTEFSFLFDGKD
ncbi:MAG: bifunctional (p)ppGpp synthetase/guanosine-3',5'-bis(diphosphate) 3'-pyrophosphohydrolase [Ruminococcaceae bacterium]|nr:bifunctional (p)ppGpp synthetase/guanosine-3',5'-bis(diphosphate) 3'-pyrophosphohydrolase [Oscillospiraceae bacterium]